MSVDEAGQPAPDGGRPPVPEGRDQSGATHPQPLHRRLYGVVRETALIVVTALVLSLVIKTFLAQAFYIPSASMHDTLVEGDRVLVSKLTPGVFDLERGDVIVFKDPGGWLFSVTYGDGSGLQDALVRGLTFVGLLPQDAGEHLIKRVIGLPGDHVTCCDASGRLTVNGESITEPYLSPGSIPSEVLFDVVVPEGHLWVMGDNRQNSQDSRAHLADPGGGMVPVDDVVGTAFVVLWPPGRLAILHDPAETFADVSSAGAS